MRQIVLTDELRREMACQAVRDAPAGWIVTVRAPKRDEQQSRRYHAMLGDLERQLPFAGQMRSKAQWKVLTVSGHAVATMHEPAEICAGLEGELVSLRESTADMSRIRAASLIAYTQAWGDLQGVRWSAPKWRDAA